MTFQLLAQVTKLLLPAITLFLGACSQAPSVSPTTPNVQITPVPMETSCGLGILNANTRIWIRGRDAQQACGHVTAMIRQQGKQPTGWDGNIAQPASDYQPVCSDALLTFSYEVVDTGGHVYGTEWCQWMARTYGVSGSVTVPDLFGIINTAQQIGDAAKVAAEDVRAVSGANNVLSQTLARIQSGTQTLKHDANFDSNLAAYAKDWAQMQDDFLTMQKDAEKSPLDCYQLDVVVKYDLENKVGYDLQVKIKYEDSSFLYTEENVDQDIDDINRSIQAAQQALSDLQSAVAVAQGKGVSLPPTISVSEVDAAIAGASKHIEDATATVQKAKAQVLDYDQKADVLYKSAQDLFSKLTCSN